MFHEKLKQKIILTLTLSVFALSACSTVMAARAYGGTGRYNHTRSTVNSPQHIRTPQPHISRPANVRRSHPLPPQRHHVLMAPVQVLQ